MNIDELFEDVEMDLDKLMNSDEFKKEVDGLVFNSEPDEITQEDLNEWQGLYDR